MNVWIAIAEYGPESDVEPIAAVGYTHDDAVKALDDLIESARVTDSLPQDSWITHHPQLMAVQGQPPTPPWQTEVFTEEDRATMIELAKDEIRDSLEDYAAEELDNYDLPSCIGIVDEDTEATVAFLTLVKDGKDFETSGDIFEFCKRFKLVEADDRIPITPLGLQYIERFK